MNIFKKELQKERTINLTKIKRNCQKLQSFLAEIQMFWSDKKFFIFFFKC